MKLVIPLLICCWCAPKWHHAQHHHCFVVVNSNGGPDHWSRPQCGKIMGF